MTCLKWQRVIFLYQIDYVDPPIEHAKTNQNTGLSRNQAVKVTSMNASQREAFEQNLKSAEEVACTLLYEDGWSLLRPKKQVWCAS